VQELVKTALALPVGTMLPFPRGTVPPGFLEVDGSAQSASVYPDLAAYLGGAFDKGDEGAGFFRLPDTRGEFLRGWDHGRGIDAGRALGSFQAEELKKHRHPQYEYDTGDTAVIPEGSLAADFNLSRTTGTERTALIGYTGGVETRPRNLAVMWCIKAWNVPVNQGNIDIAALAAQVAASATPINYVSGLILSMTAANPTTSVDLSAGVARGAADDPVVSNGVLSGVLQATGSWSAGAGGNKLDTGARAVSTWYHCFVLRRISDGLADFLLSASIGAPVVPAGYALVARLKGRAVKTDAAGFIVPFINYGRSTDFKSPQRDMRLTGGSARSTVVAVSAPPGVPVLARHYAAITGENGMIFVRSPDADEVAVGPIGNNVTNLYFGGIGQGNTGLNSENVSGYCEARTNALGQVVAQVYIAGSYTIIEAWLLTIGWTEE
jgi:microcystin-dependent protein